VLESGFKGLYLDANAISPERAKRLGGRMAKAGISFVDGGIIGGPASEPKTTYFYLSGEDAPRIASCLSAGPLETCILGDSIGRASALKMCYAAYTKGTTALLCAVLAAAEVLEIRDELEEQWSRDGSERPAQANERARRATAKAWRFVGEMHEIAMTLSSVGLPGGFHSAAGEIYDRMAHFKGRNRVACTGGGPAQFDQSGSEERRLTTRWSRFRAAGCCVQRDTRLGWPDGSPSQSPP